MCSFMFQIRLNCSGQNRSTPLPSHPSLHFHLDIYPHFFFFLFSLPHLSSYEEGGKVLLAISTTLPPLHPYFSPPLPFPTLLLPIRSREDLSNNTLHLHIHTHIHTHSHRVPPHPCLFHVHTLIFCAQHFKHMKGSSAGTKAKGKVGGGGMEKEEEGREYKSSA